MTKNIRITYRRRHSYRTAGNKAVPVKTPGGKLVAHYMEKRAKGPKCGECGEKIQGIPAVRPAQMARLKKTQRTVARAYGGNKCATCVKNRIMRAFLIEEQKVAKKIVATRAKKAKAKARQQKA